MKKFIFILLIGIIFFIPKNITYGSPIFITTETWNEKEVDKIFEKYYGDFEDYEKLNFVLNKSEKEDLIKIEVNKEQWQLILKKYNEKYNDKKKKVRFDKNDFIIRNNFINFFSSYYYFKSKA
mgnify:CR=1 FL=1